MSGGRSVLLLRVDHRGSVKTRCFMMAGKSRVLSAAVVVAALMAGPADAAKHSKKKTPMPKTDTSQIQPPIYGWAGQYRGTDPDPNIRFQLMRDQNLR
jgi:hypothetical protein